MKNEIMIIDEKTIEDKIYVVRGKQVMIDSDLAEIYGYDIKNFNRQIKNNIERFDEDFMFKLTKEEYENLRCKNCTSSWGGRRYNPNVFTEQGIYMLMTILRGELAIKQSKSLIRIFKKMKDYIIEKNSLSGYDKVIKLALQTKENTDDIKIIKKELNTIHKFLDVGYDKEIIILNGQQVESNLAYKQIYGLAKESIYIVDDYISLKTLVLLKDIDKNVKITIFSDNVGKKLHKVEYNDFVNEYNYLNISFKTTNNKFHDRYIIIDSGKRNEKIFHCGSSSKDSGKKITTIMEINDKKLYSKIINDLIKNDELKLS